MWSVMSVLQQTLVKTGGNSPTSGRWHEQQYQISTSYLGEQKQMENNRGSNVERQHLQRIKGLHFRSSAFFFQIRGYDSFTFLCSVLFKQLKSQSVARTNFVLVAVQQHGSSTVHPLVVL